MSVQSAKNSSLALTISIVIVSCLALAFPPLPLLTLMADSEQYEAMSREISSGTFLQPLDLSQRSHLASAMRPPLYPLLLVAAHHIPGLNANDALISLHILLGCSILATTPWVLRRVIPPPITACATGIALLSAKQVAYGAMSEWLTMSLLFLSFISYILWRERQTSAGASVTIGLVSLAILTRTAVVPWLALFPIMLVQSDTKKRWSTVRGVGLGLLPLFAWATVNLTRLDAFTLGKYEGLNLLATARSLGAIPLSPDDPQETRNVIEYINTHGITPSPNAFEREVVHQWDGEYYAAFHKNFDTSCDAVITKQSANLPGAAALAARSITAHRDNYRAFVRGGLYTFSRDYAPLIALCLIASLWLARRTPSMSVWSSSVTTVCALSLIYLGSVFGTILWLHRYIMPIQPVLVFCTIVSAARLITSFRGSSKTTKI